MSYASADRRRAGELAAALESRGWTVFWDNPALSGQLFKDMFILERRDARCIVVLWSKASLQSDWVNADATAALESGRLLPILIEHVNLPSRFQAIETVDLSDWRQGKPHDEFDRLVHSIAARVPRSPAAPAAQNPQDATATPPGPAEPSADYTLLDVLVATTRKRTGSEDLAEAFGPERADLQTLIVRVSIPRAHRIGNVERPSRWRLEFGEQPENHVVIRDSLPLSVNQLASRLVVTPPARIAPAVFALVMIHGWNTPFDSSVRDAAALSFDLRTQGHACLYAWPSQARVASYLTDQTNAEAAIPGLENILGLAVEAGSEPDLIAWDMGCQIAIKALEGVRPTGSRRACRHLILVAPDIDADVFSHYTKGLIGRVGRITVYVVPGSAATKALTSLRGGSSIVGASGTAAEFEGVDLIEVENPGLARRGYFGQPNDLLGDVINVLQDLKPGDRFGLHPREHGGWLLRS